MFSNVRDTVSALLMLPLAISGFGLGMSITSILTSKSSGTAVPDTIAIQSGSGSMLGTIIAILFCVGIPAAYFAFIRFQIKQNPQKRFFGELGAPMFVALSVISYVLPLILGIVLMAVWT